MITVAVRTLLPGPLLLSPSGAMMLRTELHTPAWRKQGEWKRLLPCLVQDTAFLSSNFRMTSARLPDCPTPYALSCFNFLRDTYLQLY